MSRIVQTINLIRYSLYTVAEFSQPLLYVACLLPRGSREKSERKNAQNGARSNHLTSQEPAAAGSQPPPASERISKTDTLYNSIMGVWKIGVHTLRLSGVDWIVLRVINTVMNYELWITTPTKTLQYLVYTPVPTENNGTPVVFDKKTPLELLTSIHVVK